MLMPMDQTKREQYLLYKMGMNLKWSLIALSSLILMVAAGACTKVERTTETIYAPGTQSDATGTSSGGGGFTDTQAMGALKIAKYALAQIIENTSDEIFVDLPEDRNKEWLVNIIRNIEYRDVSESRYGRLLSFNYDLENEEVYVTREFVLTFSPLRLQVNSTEMKFAIVTDIMLSILHEVSHFYNIGTNEESDVNSELWADYVIRQALSEVFVCDNGTDIGVTIHRPTGITHVVKVNHEGGVFKINPIRPFFSGAVEMLLDLMPTGNFEALDEWKDNSFKSVYLLYVRLASQKFGDEVPSGESVNFADLAGIDGMGILDYTPHTENEIIPEEFPDDPDNLEQNQTSKGQPTEEDIVIFNGQPAGNLWTSTTLGVKSNEPMIEMPAMAPSGFFVYRPDSNIVLSMARLPEFGKDKVVYSREYWKRGARFSNKEEISISMEPEYFSEHRRDRLAAHYRRVVKDHFKIEDPRISERKFSCDLIQRKLAVKPFAIEKPLTKEEFGYIILNQAVGY